MQTVSSTYTALLAANARRETKVVIGSTTYGEDKLIAVDTKIALFSSLAVGKCVSREITLTLRNPGTIARMAQISLYVRLTNGVTNSEWLPKGTFFIDTRSYDAVSDQLTIHGYDAMLKTEQSYTTSGDQGSWPQSDISVVNAICTRIGVTLDSRTASVIVKGYNVEYPGIVTTNNTPKYTTDGALTVREVLGYIGAMYGGNWCITEDNKLFLCQLTYNGGSASYNSMGSFDTAPAFSPISRVTLIRGIDDDGIMRYYTAGSDTGRTLEADCRWATQTMANNLLTLLSGFVYRPFEGARVFVDPAAQVGDQITVNNVGYIIDSMATTFDTCCTADLEAPRDEEIDHEYPYVVSPNRAIERKVAETRASIDVAVDSITMEVTNSATGKYATITLKDKDGVVIATSGQITLGGTVVFTGDLVDGTTQISGSNITTGTINAARLNLTGAITWNDLAAAVQDAINSAGGDDNPPYIKSTYIDFDQVVSPYIKGGTIGLYGGTFDVMDETGVTRYGYIGKGNGNDGNSTTDGVIMAYGGKSGLGSGDYYLICTNAGVRMQGGTNALYVTANGVCKVINGVSTEIGAAVFL